MTIVQLLEVGLPLAAILVAGFGANWYAMHRGLTDIRKELGKIAERVARIEGQLQTPIPKE